MQSLYGTLIQKKGLKLKEDSGTQQVCRCNNILILKKLYNIPTKINMDYENEYFTNISV